MWQRYGSCESERGGRERRVVSLREVAEKGELGVRERWQRKERWWLLSVSVRVNYKSNIFYNNHDIRILVKYVLEKKINNKLMKMFIISEDILLF